MKEIHGLNIELPEDKEEDKHWKYPKDGQWAHPTGRYDWVKPVALQWGEWDEWKADMKAKYPVRFFLHETIPDKWSDVWEYGSQRYFRNLKWKILHRFHPKHRYHVVDTGLEPGYYDPCTQIFASNFQLLCDFVDNNVKWDRIDWEGDEAHVAAWKEMNELVHWYREIYPNREDSLEVHRPEPRVEWKKVFNEKHKDDPDVIEYRKYLDYVNTEEAQWEKDDEENLIRVIKLIPFLWYA
jgi:hypothetical protein